MVKSFKETILGYIKDKIDHEASVVLESDYMYIINRIEVIHREEMKYIETLCMAFKVSYSIAATGDDMKIMFYADDRRPSKS